MKFEKKEAPPVVQPPPEYVITLTAKEALHLFHLIGCIGGDAAYPERQVTDELYGHLRYEVTLFPYTPFKNVYLERKP
jgi:hypothetical protein